MTRSCLALIVLLSSLGTGRLDNQELRGGVGGHHRTLQELRVIAEKEFSDSQQGVAEQESGCSQESQASVALGDPRGIEIAGTRSMSGQ